MAQGKTFKPKGIYTRGAFTETVGQNQMGASGRVDYEQTENDAALGQFTRRLVADPPGGFIFVCACGWKRRVTGEETNFHCEATGWNDQGQTFCLDGKTSILWSRLRKPLEGEFDEFGGQAYEDITTEETVEVPDEYTGKKRKIKIQVPVFEGRLLGDVKREEFARRKAAGEPVQVNPSNVVMMNTYEKKNEGETPADRVKPKDEKKK